jgi:hypothetical protein
MIMPETTMSEYIKGFNSGYEYVLHEVENFIKAYPTKEFALLELLAHLKMEGKPH